MFLIFPSIVQILTEFSIVYMIRIRFFGLRKLIQDAFSDARYEEWGEPEILPAAS